MKQIITGAVCSSLLLLAGCNDSPTTAQDTSPAVATAKTALASGVDLAFINKDVRPQDDFYHYVNGLWLENTEIPADKTVIGSFADLNEKASEDIKVIIEELAATENLAIGSDEQKVADLFRTYMDTETLNANGMKPVEGLLADIDAISTKDELVVQLAKSQMMGLDAPFQYYVSIDAKESSRYAGHVWQSGLGLPDRDYYFNEEERFVEMRASYVAHVENMFALAGMEAPADAAKSIMALETKIANLHNTQVENRDAEKRYNKFATKDLNDLNAQFNWSLWLDTLGVSDQSDIIINQPNYISAFGDVFANTDIDTWKTYLDWQVINGFSSYLTEALATESFNFYGKNINGQKEQKIRWKRGVSLINGNLGEIVAKVYVKRHFSPEAKTRMTALVENLRTGYGESIDALEWMSADTKKAARVKLAAFTPKIGYPDRWEDYSDIKISNDNLIANLISVDHVGHAKQIEKLSGPIRKWEWHMTPQTVNAYYSPTANEIVFPAAILQPPFFNLAADDAVNYGGIGAVIGHEMGHGFDDQGSKYDAEGNMQNWWTENDLKEFTERSSQLVEQYSAYAPFDDSHVNGELTLGENIGDLSGLTIAYRAYKSSLNGEEAPVIDGLTGEQRFFMGWAQVWRVKRTEKALRKRVETDPHSPSHYRVIGTLSNMTEFADAYDVKEGDAMYIAPEKRVKIW